MAFNNCVKHIISFFLLFFFLYFFLSFFGFPMSHLAKIPLFTLSLVSLTMTTTLVFFFTVSGVCYVTAIAKI